MAWTERYVSVSGAGLHDGTSEANAWTLAEAIAAMTSYATTAVKIWVKSGTYTNSSDVNLDFGANAGYAHWWCGYNSTTGDLDFSLSTTNLPHFEMTGASTDFIIQTTSANQWFSNIKFTSERGVGNAFSFQGPGCRAWNCYFENTNAAATGSAVGCGGTGDGMTLVLCEITSVSDFVIDVGGNSPAAISGCNISGGEVRTVEMNSSTAFAYNIIHDSSADAAAIENTTTQIGIHNTFYNISDDANVKSATAATLLSHGNLFSTIGGYANEDDAASGAMFIISNNVYYSVTAGQTSGIPENEQWNAISASTEPMINPSAGNYSLDSSKDAVAAGAIVWLDSDTIDYADAGAIQAQRITAIVSTIAKVLIQSTVRLYKNIRMTIG